MEVNRECVNETDGDDLFNVMSEYGCCNEMFVILKCVPSSAPPANVMNGDFSVELITC